MKLCAIKGLVQEVVKKENEVVPHQILSYLSQLLAVLASKANPANNNITLAFNCSQSIVNNETFKNVLTGMGLKLEPAPTTTYSNSNVVNYKIVILDESEK